MENIEIFIAGLVMLVSGLALWAKLTKSKKDDKIAAGILNFLKKVKSLISFKSSKDDEKEKK